MGCIFGLLGTTAPADGLDMLERMQSAMRFRSPAHAETVLTQGALLGAAGDIEGTGEYLVTDAPGQVIAACEGEIYNARELAERFGPDTDQRETRSGFHLVPQLYRAFGRDFAGHLNGVFTIALWDAETRTLHLVRDHVGSHSLFHARAGDLLFFATTIKALLATGRVSRRIHREGPARYFASKALTPPQTMFADVLAVRPAHVCSVKGAAVEETDYWHLGEVTVEADTPAAEFAERMRAIILDAIRIRCAAGGRIGSLMSGGMDTGVVSATLAGLLGDVGLDVFSVAFEEASYSDGPLQDVMLARYPLRGHQHTLRPVEFAEIMAHAVQFLDSPVNDNAYVGLYRAFALARDCGLTVVFEGEGPDEIFPAGNTQGERTVRPFLALPYGLRRLVFATLAPAMPLGDSLLRRCQRFAARLGMQDAERMVTWRTYFHRRLLTDLLHEPHWPTADPYEEPKRYLTSTRLADPLNRYQYGLVKCFLPDDLLFKDERMAAALGLINRAPLIDHRLVELALSIPSALQIRKPTPVDDGIKLLYKQALEGLIPGEILARKKLRGFSQPTPLWYRGELKEFVRDLLLGRRTRERGFLREGFVRNLFDRHVSGHSNLDYALSSIMIFELWMRAFIDER